MDTIEFACSLSAQSALRRQSDLRELSKSLLSHELVAGRATLVFASGQLGAVHELIESESLCCPFFVFQVDASEEAVTMVVTTAPGGQPVLESFIEHLRRA